MWVNIWEHLNYRGAAKRREILRKVIGRDDGWEIEELRSDEEHEECMPQWTPPVEYTQ